MSAFEQFAAELFKKRFPLDSLEIAIAKKAFNAGLEAAAKLMENRKVMASEFYANEIRALKEG